MDKQVQEAGRLLLSVPEAAESLNVSDRFVEYAIARGELPSVRLGRRRLIRPADLNRFVADRLERVAV